MMNLYSSKLMADVMTHKLQYIGKLLLDKLICVLIYTQWRNYVGGALRQTLPRCPLHEESERISLVIGLMTQTRNLKKNN